MLSTCRSSFPDGPRALHGLEKERGRNDAARAVESANQGLGARKIAGTKIHLGLKVYGEAFQSGRTRHARPAHAEFRAAPRRRPTFQAARKA